MSYLRQPYGWFLSKNSSNLVKQFSVVILFTEGNSHDDSIAQGVVAVAIITLIIIVDPILALRVGLVFDLLFINILFLKI